MSTWPRMAALAVLLGALGLLAVFQWLPALFLLPAAGALLAWGPIRSATRSRARNTKLGHY